MAEERVMNRWLVVVGAILDDDVVVRGAPHASHVADEWDCLTGVAARLATGRQLRLPAARYHDRDFRRVAVPACGPA